MELFTIVPRDTAGMPASYRAFDSSSALTAMQHLGCECADIFQAKRYRFSLEINDSGVWTVFERHADSFDRVYPSGFAESKDPAGYEIGPAFRIGLPPSVSAPRLTPPETPPAL